MSAWPLSPPGCALSPQVQDGLLAVFVAWFQVRGTRIVAVGQELARPLTKPADLGYLLLIVSGLMLLVRRRWPVAVFTTVTYSVVDDTVVPVASHLLLDKPELCTRPVTDVLTTDPAPSPLPIRRATQPTTAN